LVTDSNLWRICDDLCLVIKVASHFSICDKMKIFDTNVSLLRDDLHVVVEVVSICDDRFWS
jgi:hypothetical protein